MAHHYGIKYWDFIKFVVILAQNCHPFARIDTYIPAGRIDIPGQDFKKSGFTGTICANNPIAISRRKLDIYLVKQDSFSELERQIISSDHVDRKK